MKKIVTVLVIVLAVIIAVFYFSKDAEAPDVGTDVLGAFSNWKTYDGKTKVGFTLKYPADWTFDDNFPDSVSFMNADGNAFNAYRVKESNRKQTLGQWLRAKDKSNSEAMGGQYNDYVISTKKAKVAKLSAVRRLEHADAAGFDVIQTYVKSGSYFYAFALGIGPSGYYTPEDEKIHDKILSTVRFK